MALLWPAYLVSNRRDSKCKQLSNHHTSYSHIIIITIMASWYSAELRACVPHYCHILATTAHEVGHPLQEERKIKLVASGLA